MFCKSFFPCFLVYSVMWSDIWNVSYIELRIWNQVSHDHRSCERNLSNCEQKPEKVRTSTGFEPVTSRYRCDALTNWMFQYMKHFIYHFTSILHALIRTHKWPAPNVSGVIAQLVRASHQYREVTGSNPVEVLTFSGFCSQLLKLRSQLRWSWLTWLLSYVWKNKNKKKTRIAHLLMTWLWFLITPPTRSSSGQSMNLVAKPWQPPVSSTPISGFCTQKRKKKYSYKIPFQI